MFGRSRRCSQCGKPAMFEVEGGHRLCLECWTKLQAAFQANLQALHQEKEALLDEFEFISGVPMRRPQPNPIITGPVHLSNIRIDRSTVGVVNTGQIGQIDAGITMIKDQMNPELASLVAQFTQSVLQEKALAVEHRNEILDLLQALSQQLATPKEQRKTGLLKAVLSGVKDLIATAAGLATLWNAVSRGLAAHLGIPL